jgi:hypothetical protein
MHVKVEVKRACIRKNLKKINKLKKCLYLSFICYLFQPQHVVVYFLNFNLVVEVDIALEKIAREMIQLRFFLSLIKQILQGFQIQQQKMVNFIKLKVNKPKIKL